MHLRGGALLHLKRALRRFNRVQRTRHKVSGPLTRDVGPNQIMKTNDETPVRPWSYLALALASAIVPFIHFRGLNQALDNTIYPWGLHPIEVLWLRDLGQYAAVLAGVLAICFVLSWRIVWFRRAKTWRRFFTAALLFWVWYSIAASIAIWLQITIGNAT